MEKWNAYTRDGVLTDKVLIRGEPRTDGLYHMVCEVLVRHIDGSYLCMKRSMKKPNYPGSYEATACGAALYGESKLDCVKRELQEETGIVCNEFHEICRYVSDEKQTIYYIFICVVDCDKDSITLQDGETEAYIWMSETEFIEFVNSDKIIDAQKERFYDYYLKMQYIK